MSRTATAEPDVPARRDAGPARPRRIPSFLVVGAQKAGTTALHAWLQALPGVCLPRDKETHYLTHPERWRLGPDWYDAQFEGAAPGDVLGEVDPELLHHPAAPERIQSVFGAPRLVVVLRDPLERARSQYEMSVARGLEPLDFPAALEAEEGRLRDRSPESRAQREHSYLARSCVSASIRRLQERFGEERVLLVRFEDLFRPTSEAARLEAFGALLAFLEIPAQARIDAPDRQHNGRWSPRSRWLSALLHDEAGLRRRLGRLVPSRALRRRIGAALAAWNRAGSTPSADRRCGSPLDPGVRARLALEIEELASLTGWDLEAWRARLASAASARRERA